MGLSRIGFSGTGKADTLRSPNPVFPGLYSLLFDRAGISKENGYIEADGTVRLYFTMEEAKRKLHRSRQVSPRAFQEIERSGLIVRQKQGLGRPAVITLNVIKPQKEEQHG